MPGKRVWNSVEYGWGPPLIFNAQGRSTGELTPKHEWDKADNEGSEVNAQALFSIFNGVCPDEFHKIENGKCVKEAWSILELTHEGMSTVKFSMLQILATKFENIRMHENPTFSSFYSELSDIVNSSLILENLFQILRQLGKY